MTINKCHIASNNLMTRDWCVSYTYNVRSVISQSGVLERSSMS